MKKCPFCAEEIQDEAVKCRFCGEFLKKKSKFFGCLTGCLVTIVVLILMGAGFVYFIYFVLDSLRYKIMAMQANMPHFTQPAFPFGTQSIHTMFNDIGEGFKIFGEFLRNGNSQQYQNINF